ncbi:MULTISPECIES: pilin [Vibrio]|uniref:pilin n=1 Tax=Vibrio TaxID=662 RepID=UPI000AF1D7AC|nr:MULTISPECIES: pilin [Vibrio]
MIELLIITAIIGGLSAISIPLYDSYLKKNEIASAMLTMNSVLTPAELYIQEYGDITVSQASALFDYAQIGPTSNYLGRLSISATNQLMFKFTHGSLGVSGAEAVLTFSRSNLTGWRCTNAQNIPQNLIPRAC